MVAKMPPGEVAPLETPLVGQMLQNRRKIRQMHKGDDSKGVLFGREFSLEQLSLGIASVMVFIVVR
jgi:hypothetical protein